MRLQAHAQLWNKDEQSLPPLPCTEAAPEHLASDVDTSVLITDDTLFPRQAAAAGSLPMW